MKKMLLMFALVSSVAMGVNAQIIRTEELEKYAKEKYGEKWTDAAANLGSQIVLDKNNAITITEVIPADGKTKEQLYVLLNYWFTASFGDGSSVIQLNDKELGTIIAKGYVPSIATHVGGSNRYNVNIEPIIKADIKDNKVRITYTVPFYTVIKAVGGGVLGAMSGARATLVEEKWVLDKCFPFAEKDGHKKTSAKAVVMANAYSNIVLDKIVECVKNGLTGNEDDNW